MYSAALCLLSVSKTSDLDIAWNQLLLYLITFISVRSLNNTDTTSIPATIFATHDEVQ